MNHLVSCINVDFKKGFIFILIQLSGRAYDLDPVNGKLILKDVKTVDAGDYACIVNTTGHQAITSSSARLTVLGLHFNLFEPF